jgi:hypothetical protein
VKKKILTGWMIGSPIEIEPRNLELYNPCRILFCSERCHRNCIRRKSCTMEQPDCQYDREKIIYGEGSNAWGKNSRLRAPRGTRRHSLEVEEMILENHDRLMLSKCQPVKIIIERD